MTSVTSSHFSYSLSRPYPYRWFTPVVFLGGTIALVLFSLLNYVSNGFQQTYAILVPEAKAPFCF